MKPRCLQPKQNNNKTGYRGVHIKEYTRKRRGTIKNVRVAVGVLEFNNIRHEINRSCNKYGERTAIRMCYMWRQDKKRELGLI